MVIKIICDTNLWYHLESGAIDRVPIENLHLVVTNLNIDEMARTPNQLNDFEWVRRVIKTIFDNGKEVIYENPWLYVLKLDNPSLNIEIQHDKFIFELTEDIANGAKFDVERIDVLKNFIRTREVEKNEIVKMYNEIFERIKHEVKGEKQKFRNLAIKSFLQDLTRERITCWSKINLDKEYSLSLNFNWDLIELFIDVFCAYYLELSLSNMKMQDNDLYDLHNLIYVKPGQLYWTCDKRWIRLINEKAKLGKYLYNAGQLIKA